MWRIRRVDPFEAFNREFNRVLERHFGNPQVDEQPGALTQWLPRADILETKEAFLTRLDLPGVLETDIRITLENNTLTISGERRPPEGDPATSFQRLECCHGSFTRSFTLPSTVDVEGIQAAFRSGVLQVTLPKRAESQPRQVPVQVG